MSHSTRCARNRFCAAGAFFIAASFGAASEARADPEGGRSVTLGGAAIVKPKYEGSDEFETIPIPIIIPKFSETVEENGSAITEVRKRVNFRGLDEIRIRVLGGERFHAGAVTGYITKRDQDDGPLLRGLGDIDGGLVAGAYTGFTLGAFQFDAAILEKVTGDDSGPEFRFGVETTQRITERTRIVARVGTTFASDDYMQTYFGVTPAAVVNTERKHGGHPSRCGSRKCHGVKGKRIGKCVRAGQIIQPAELARKHRPATGYVQFYFPEYASFSVYKRIVVAGVYELQRIDDLRIGRGYIQQTGPFTNGIQQRMQFATCRLYNRRKHRVRCMPVQGVVELSLHGIAMLRAERKVD
jgi:outer membrane scaffolding protein for murein synthesis (MipA/OmpV family)